MNITVERLQQILLEHSQWMSGSGGQRADLQGADLQDAYLQGAYLRDADFQGANLRDADLQGAYLQGAYLRDADFRGAYLRGADLQGAYLQGANLRDADFRGANLRDADLQGANLRDADLRGANLRDANLRGAKTLSALALSQTEIVPREGSFIGWKKCMQGIIVKLRIPEEAKRSNATGRKCRAEFVQVLEILESDHGVSSHDGVTTYRAGEIVRCDQWESDRLVECGGGIHFFLTEEEARAY